MTRSEHNPWLTRFATFVAVNTLMLIAIGGLVTSKGVGMAVPDWPTTYGYNMFFFPISLWRGGIFFEHTHRLFASWVGLLTIGLAIWLWCKESRSWLRWLGVVALGLVILQGVLGGLRVVLFRDQIGIAHAALAQSFLVVVASIALFSSLWWRRLSPIGLSARLRNLLLLTTGLVFVQLLLGATMRHEHAGLAVPDFPLAYGKLWPATDAKSLQYINQSRGDVGVTAFQIYFHMAHRFGALTVLVVSFAAAYQIWKTAGTGSLLSRGVILWQGLILLQGLLGAATVWTGKSADIATLHVIIGAVVLVQGVFLVLVADRQSGLLPAASSASVRPAETVASGASCGSTILTSA